jgi:hypothetical protein
LIGPGFDLLKLLGPTRRPAIGVPARLPAGNYSEQLPKKPHRGHRVTPWLTSAEDLHAARLLSEWIGKRLNVELGR